MEEIYDNSNNPELAYIYLLNLKISMNEFIKELTKIVCSKMKFDHDHPLRQFRKCPYCGIIWYRPYGCDIMQCGVNVKKL